jgi:hypothetical protein
VVALTGPRQSGKTTLARQVFADKPYFTLEDVETRQRVVADPRQFFAHLPTGAVLDGVQRCPEIFSYLQGVVDERARMGEFVITGSQQFGLVERITLSPSLNPGWWPKPSSTAGTRVCPPTSISGATATRFRACKSWCGIDWEDEWFPTRNRPGRCGWQSRRRCRCARTR